jgi:hypothetical protein
MTIAENSRSFAVQFSAIFLTKISEDPENTVVVASLQFK